MHCDVLTKSDIHTCADNAVDSGHTQHPNKVTGAKKVTQLYSIDEPKAERSRPNAIPWAISAFLLVGVLGIFTALNQRMVQRSTDVTELSPDLGLSPKSFA